MPELPEVERFRQILFPLVHRGSNAKDDPSGAISFELVGPEDKLPRKWIRPEDIDAVDRAGPWRCRDVVRKGKQLCMVLESSNGIRHLFLHMGMTGRLISPSASCSWGQKYVSSTHDIGEEWPPRFTYLVMRSGDAKVAFADPRKFGGCYFAEPDGTGISDVYRVSSSALEELAPDGWLETSTPEQRWEMVARLADQRLGVKALILDQKRVVSGVGNWVADEVLYQCEIHPDQSHLTDHQAMAVVTTLHDILQVAVDCLDQDVPYPDTWLFGYRWTKKQAGKDHKGRNLTFLTSGGRTSAIVASIQKLRKGQGKHPQAKSSGSDPSKTTPKKRSKKRVVTPDAGDPGETSSRKRQKSSREEVVVKLEAGKCGETPSHKKRKTRNKEGVVAEEVPSINDCGHRRSGRTRKPTLRYADVSY